MFQNAVHSIMIGHHPDLATYSNDSIPLEGDFEKQIMNKIRDLAKTYSPE
jgi:hypothetical protein